MTNDFIFDASSPLSDTLVLRRARAQPNIWAVAQALQAQINWDESLLNTQIKTLLPPDTLEPASESWHVALRQFRYAAVAALACIDDQNKHDSASHSLNNSVGNTAQHTTLLSVVVSNMSVWADWALQHAVRVVGHEGSTRYGKPIDNQGATIDLQVIAMGKLGGYELNVSSDIDLIFLARTLDGDTAGVNVQGVLRACSNNEFMQQWAKGVVALLSSNSEQGFAFRVDTLLRPHGRSGPLVLEHASLEEYLLTQGRMWERLAWLKARAVQTPCFESNLIHLEHHAAWQTIVSPFVYRRYLDFTVLDSLRELHGRIRRERNTIEANPNQGLHLKLARGGIRELEFWLQGQQLIRAGRDPSLRGKDTLGTLVAMADAGVITLDLAQSMAHHYVLLRRAEHAVQYVEDAQTHHLPVDDGARLNIAKAVGFTDLVQFDSAISQAMLAIATQFDRVFAHRQDVNTQANIAPNDIMHPPHIQIALEQVQQWPLNDASRLSVLALLDACADPEGDVATFDRLVAFIKSISKRKTYIDLLLTHRPALSRVKALMAASPFAAHYLHSHPALIDELIDGHSLQSAMNPEYWQLERQRLLTRLNDLDEETQLHVLCEAHHAWVLKILVQDAAQNMSGTLDVRAVSDCLSQAADLILEATLCCVNQALQGDFSLPVGLGIIAYGKLGGKELGYGSDLDIVFVYDDTLAKESLNNNNNNNNNDSQYTDDMSTRYAKLVQRLMSWLSVHTAAGRLFEIDTALRPNGGAGKILSTIEAFSEYQIGHAPGTHAWLWEHQAISRARLAVGDKRLAVQFDALREQILCLPRELNTLKNEVISMRKRIASDKKSQVADHLFDAKNSAGGMIDIEFAVQYAVLRYARTYSDLRGNTGNVALLKVMAQAGLIESALAQQVGHVYMYWRKAQHRCQLQLQSRVYLHSESPEHLAMQGGIAAVAQLWQVLGLV
jgi:[glutamine synthetase] adenylyltransferase / [glutamine synthetase]-adenylyl-L-tyrosine phosphorylase